MEGHTRLWMISFLLRALRLGGEEIQWLLPRIVALFLDVFYNLGQIASRQLGTCLPFYCKEAVKMVIKKKILVKVLQAGKCPSCVWSTCALLMRECSKGFFPGISSVKP